MFQKVSMEKFMVHFKDNSIMNLQNMKWTKDEKIFLIYKISVRLLLLHVIECIPFFIEVLTECEDIQKNEWTIQNSEQEKIKREFIKFKEVIHGIIQTNNNVAFGNWVKEVSRSLILWDEDEWFTNNSSVF